MLTILKEVLQHTADKGIAAVRNESTYDPWVVDRNFPCNQHVHQFLRYPDLPLVVARLYNPLYLPFCEYSQAKAGH